jgi:hypothetical protein
MPVHIAKPLASTEATNTRTSTGLDAGVQLHALSRLGLDVRIVGNGAQGIRISASLQPQCRVGCGAVSSQSNGA